MGVHESYLRYLVTVIMEADAIKTKSLTTSIILNVFNAEKLIGKFLDQLKHQSTRDFELVIIDDGCTDNTLKVIDQYTSDFQVKVITLPHVGLRTARARGIEVASGEVCIVLDADEIIDDPDLIQKFVEPFMDARVAAVGGSIRPLGDGWVVTAQRLDRQFRQKVRAAGQGGKAWSVMGGISAMRRSAVIAVGGMTKGGRLAGDTDISIRLRKSGWKLVQRDDIVVGHPDPNTIRAHFAGQKPRGREPYSFF